MHPFKRAERWLRKDLRQRLGRVFHTRAGRKFLARYLPAFVTHVSIDCGDHRLTVSPHELVGRRVIREGHFSRDLTDRVVAELAAQALFDGGRDVALDIGANIGTQTLYFCLSGRFRRVLAIEPAASNLELLALNVRQNGLDDRVTIMPCAAGDTDGERTLYLDGDNHGANSFVNTRSATASAPVPVRRVDTMMAEAGIDPDRVALIWMDIEGYEPVACRSMEGLLRRQTPLVTEFQSDFLGREGSAAFIAYLAGFYQRCIVFPEHGPPAERRVSDIRIQSGILDVLLLPD